MLRKEAKATYKWPPGCTAGGPLEVAPPGRRKEGSTGAASHTGKASSMGCEKAFSNASWTLWKLESWVEGWSPRVPAARSVLFLHRRLAGRQTFLSVPENSTFTVVMSVYTQLVAAG